MSHPFNAENRYGSARWAEEHELRKAGLFKKHGVQIGYWGKRHLCIDGDAPMVTIGGAGSGKFRDVLSFVACTSPGMNQVWLDPRGEISEVSEPSHAKNGDYAYRFNPLRLFGAASHKINPLECLTRESSTLQSDCTFIAKALVTLNGGGENGNYFDLRARDWIEKILISLVYINGRITLTDLHGIINMIESDPQAWADYLELMLACPLKGVRRVASEMLTKQQDSPREFGSVMGSVYAALSFLDDPVLLEEVSEAELSLFDLLKNDRGRKLFLNIPAEFLSQWSPLIRLIFTVVMLLKGRAPEAPRMMLIVDEAGQLGHFEALLHAFTFGRGAGIRAWALFQDIGQITRNYTASAVSSFLGSAQTRQFFGVRDYETAELVSNMLGHETLLYDDEKQQTDARIKKRQALQAALFNGQDPLGEGVKYVNAKREEFRKSKQVRRLLTAEEIMALPEDQQIIFVSGKDLPPILGNKYPYFKRREMAGRYLANPHHPPADKVKIKGWLWSRWVKIAKQPVRKRFASFPQYKDGYWRYCRGFKP